MERLVVFTLLFFGCNVITSGQLKVDSTYSRFFEDCNVECLYFERDYAVYNNTNEDYIIWISPSSISGKSQEQLIKDMFFRREGDFNLFQIMTDCYIEKYDLWGIGFNFMKKLAPGETFNLYVLLNENKTFFYKDKIVSIKKCDIEKFLKIRINDTFFYEGNHIIINDLCN